MSSDYTNEEAKQDQAMDDFLDMLSNPEKAVMKEYYADYQIHYKPELKADWKLFIKIIKACDDGSFEENIACDIDYDFEPLLESISNDTVGMIGVLVDIEKAMEDLAEGYFNELRQGIDGQLEAMNDA